MKPRIPLSSALALTLSGMLLAVPAGAQQSTDTSTVQSPGTDTSTTASPSSDASTTPSSSSATSGTDSSASDSSTTGMSNSTTSTDATAGAGGMDPAGSSSTAGESGGGASVMLDVETFTQDIYERGFRQGYLRGMVDSRHRFGREMQRLHERTSAGKDGKDGKDGKYSDMSDSASSMQGMDPGAQGSSSATSSKRGAVIFLPEGMTPERFIEQLDKMNSQGSDSQGSAPSN